LQALFLLPSAHCFATIRLSPTFKAALNIRAAGQPGRGYSTKRLSPQPAQASITLRRRA